MTILIIDDNVDLLEILKMEFEVHGVRVTTAVNGQLGLEAFKVDATIAMVLTDFNMPVLDGIEFLKAVRVFDQSTPVFLMTGNHELKLQDAKNFGATNVFYKPFVDVKKIVALLQPRSA